MKCTSCGAPLSDEDRFCRACGAKRPEPRSDPERGMPAPFVEARRRLEILQGRRRAGELDERAYEAARRDCMVQDDRGTYWAPGEERGEWYGYDGDRWARRDPPAISAPAPGPPPDTKAFPWRWLAVGGAGLLVLAVVAGVVLARRWLPPAAQRPEVVLVVTDTPTPSATATSLWAEMTEVAAGQPSETAVVEPTATRTPTRIPTAAPTSTPVPEDTSTATPSPQSTPTPGATPKPQATAAPTSAPASGAVVDFEQWGTWRRGDQPYGTLSQTEANVHSGRYAAALRYDFPVVNEDFVVFLRRVSLAGQPDRFSAWVYGDGSGNYLNLWVEDAEGETWAVHLGEIGGPTWRSMTGVLDPAAAWPSGHVDGPDNGVVDYPIAFRGLVLDRVGSGPRSGQIVIDDISAWGGGGGASPTPAEGTATATVEAPGSAGPLSFAEPTRLDGWEDAEGGKRVTIRLQITGGLPPFTIRHEGERFETDARDYALRFVVDRCAILGTIRVESADGQAVSHDYWISAPWCD